MTIEAQYAEALFALVEKDPSKAGDYLANLKKTLEKKGHQQLLSRVFSEYRRIIERRERSESYKHITPEQERTRALLELYRTLVTS